MQAIEIMFDYYRPDVFFIHLTRIESLRETIFISQNKTLQILLLKQQLRNIFQDFFLVRTIRTSFEDDKNVLNINEDFKIKIAEIFISC